MSVRQILFVGVTLLAVVAAWEVLPADDAADRSSPKSLAIDQLYAQILVLEERIRVLEGQLSGIQPAGALVMPSRPVNTPYDPSIGRVPPNWRVGEINGLKFYTAPLSAQTESAPTPAKQATLR